VSRSAKPSKEFLERHTDVSFPRKVRLGQTTNLRVLITPQAGRHYHDQPLLLGVSHQICVTVFVAAENFTIEGDTRADIVVPLKGDSNAINFRLTGEEVGPGRIMLDFVQDGRALGSVNLTPEVVASDPKPNRQPTLTRGKLYPRTKSGPAPEVTITVHEYVYSRGRLHFMLHSRDARLRDVPLVMHGDLGTVDLHGEVVNWVADQFDMLNTGRIGPVGGDGDRLSEFGNRLFERALPKPLRDLCWVFHERGIKSVLVLSDEPHIPWELIKPIRENSATQQMEELPFWGESFALGRWLRGPTTAERFALHRVTTLAAGAPNPTRDLGLQGVQPAIQPASAQLHTEPELDNAVKELDLILSLEKSVGASVRILRACRDELRKALEQADFDLLHLISHGTFSGGSRADASAVWMDDGAFHAGELAPGLVEKLRPSAPLIVFNACSTGRTGYSLTQLGSWGAEFIQKGCGGFIGTLWRVTDDGAVAFAEAFYQFLTESLPIGEALRRARLEVHRRFPADSTWLAYCCFADPTARLDKTGQPPASGGLAPASRPG
jgi:hypothetical protein